MIRRGVKWGFRSGVLCILQSIGVIKDTALRPTVTTLRTTPKEISELQKILNRSNIVVTTMSLLQRFSDYYLTAISEICDTLIVDEAHHEVK
ncbi:MAG: hypothetical protein APF76_06845 [Desulfitibacter sp. BRH_c19]|nr:MAG: hypothetical protein APF76_06845 [Desulfitibacter sp. BRH_c19]